MLSLFLPRSEFAFHPSIYRCLYRFSQQTIAISLSFVAFTVATPAKAQLFDSPVDRLPVVERVALRRGEPVVTGDQGRYVAKVLVTAKPEIVWAVLTDYDNFARFLPNVASSRVLESNGNRKVLEQVNTGQVLFIKVRSRIRTAITETSQQQIEFKLIDGDLKKLQGYWLLEPIAPYSGAPADQILITQTIEVQPSSGLPKDAFYNIFKDTLKKSMTAIHQEIKRRSQSSPSKK